MTRARFCRVGLSAFAAVLLVGCSTLAVVDDNLAASGGPSTEFSIDDQAVTLSARFNTGLAADEPLMVEWLLPDGKVYLRKPVSRSHGNDNVLETSLPVRGKGPARRPGIWQVRLWHDGRLLVNRSFEIHKAAETAMSAGASFAGLAHCGPSRWSDPVISTRNSVAVASGRPGAWVGGELLDVAGPTYSSVVLLTGCAPG